MQRLLGLSERVVVGCGTRAEAQGLDIELDEPLGDILEDDKGLSTPEPQSTKRSYAAGRSSSRAGRRRRNSPFTFEVLRRSSKIE